MAADVMICAQSAQVLVGDGDHLESVVADLTTAHADHPVVVGYPHLWRPLEVNYSTSALVEEDEAAPDNVEPTPADVRSWATDNDIDVNAKGKLPDAVVERYKQAQG